MSERDAQQVIDALQEYAYYEKVGYLHELCTDAIREMRVCSAEVSELKELTQGFVYASEYKELLAEVSRWKEIADERGNRLKHILAFAQGSDSASTQPRTESDGETDDTSPSRLMHELEETRKGLERCDELPDD